VLVRELLVAELAVVEVVADVDVPVHPHVVARGVVLPAVHAHVPLLPTASCSILLLYFVVCCCIFLCFVFVFISGALWLFFLLFFKPNVATF
jgi:hypothetical protein